MISTDDQAKLTLQLKSDPELANNMLQHGLVQRLVDGSFILTSKGEFEMAERDRRMANFERKNR